MSNLASFTLIGTIIDLWKLAFKPVDSTKELSNAFRKKSCLASAFMKIRVSSAY